MYIASGNVLYVYNHKDNTVKPLRSDFGRTIRDIAVCPTNSVVGDGKTLEGMEFIGKFGRVVDLIYKIGNQWDTY